MLEPSTREEASSPENHPHFLASEMRSITRHAREKAILSVEILYWLLLGHLPAAAIFGSTQPSVWGPYPSSPLHLVTSSLTFLTCLTSTRQRARLMLGVFDASKGKLTLSGVRGDTVCRLEPRIHGVKYEPAPKEAPKEDEANDLLALRRERNARLIEAFGSQRRKRQLANAQAGRVDASQIGGGNAIMNIIKSSESAAATAGSKEEFIRRALADRNIPPHNPEATTPDAAYPFDSIVPGVIRDAIDTSFLQRAVDSGDEVPDTLSEVRRTFGSYVASRVGASSGFDAQDGALDSRFVSLAFLGHLIPFYTNPKRLIIKIQSGPTADGTDGGGGVAGCAEGMKMAASTLEGILSLFYNRESSDGDDGPSKYVMDKRRRNLLLTWILTLAVRSEPSSVLPAHATKKLVEELRLKPAEVAAVFRELGMTPIRSGQSYSVRLLQGGQPGEQGTLEAAFPDIRMPRAKAK